MVSHFFEHKLIKTRGKQRTDSTQVVAAIRQVNRLELVGETLRATLNQIAKLAPEWLQEIISEDWFDRYSERFENYRLPKEKTKREEMAFLIGRDEHHLMEKLWSEDDPQAEKLRQIESVDTLICPEISRCTKRLKAPRKLKLRPRDEYESLNARRQEQKTKEFKKKYSCRAGIEGTISQGVRKLDLRRTRYSGLAKTHLQHIATARCSEFSSFPTALM